MSRIVATGVLSLACLASAVASGQQPSLPNALTQNEYLFDTVEQGKIRVSVLVKELKSPWALAFLPSGDALISERGGDLRVVHNAIGTAATLDPQPVSGLPHVDPPVGRVGLHDVVLHPQFEKNKLIYFTFNKPVGAGNKQAAIALFRGWRR